MPETRFDRRPPVRRRSTRPTATCSTRPGPGPPRGWWPWPTTRRPAGAGWAAAGRRRPGPTCCFGPAPPRPRRPNCHLATHGGGPGRRPTPAPTGRPGSAPGLKWPNDLVAGDGGSWPGSWPRPTWPPAGPAGVAGRWWSGIGINVNWPAADDDCPPSWRGGRRRCGQLAGRRRRPGGTARAAARRPGAAGWPTWRRRGPAPAGRRPPAPVHHPRARRVRVDLADEAVRGHGRRRSPPRATWWSSRTAAGPWSRATCVRRRRRVPTLRPGADRRPSGPDPGVTAAGAGRTAPGYAGPLCDSS